MTQDEPSWEERLARQSEQTDRDRENFERNYVQIIGRETRMVALDAAARVCARYTKDVGEGDLCMVTLTMAERFVKFIETGEASA